MLTTAIRIILLSLILYTGPGHQSPAETTATTITVTIPAALIAGNPVCAIG